MAETPFDNIYDLSTSQLERLDEAEDLMLKNDLGAAERLLLTMLDEDDECIPVLIEFEAISMAAISQI